MLMRKAEAEWKGNLIQGNGRLAVGSGAFDLPYSFKARFEDGQPDTNPEELIGAARRRAAIAELYTEDCELYVPPGKFVGPEALDKFVGDLRATNPHFVLAREACGNSRAAGPPGQGPGRSRSSLHQALPRRPSQL